MLLLAAAIAALPGPLGAPITLDELAIVYEDVAYASVGESKQEQVRTTLACTRG